MIDTSSHHIIYGTITDFITGETIPDTDDERYRQNLARFMVEEKGYAKTGLEVRQTIETLFAGQAVVSKITLVLSLHRKRFMLLRYGPGSLVTRERPAISASRVLDPAYQIPLTVVTNGEDAEVLDTYTGKVIKRGLAGIPDKNEAEALFPSLAFKPTPGAEKKEKELRILNAFDVEVCCAGKKCLLPNDKK
ncbi:MAG: type I restriction enzyme HsdR N-terminal domain-containing protein [Desulfobulbaceae bacterium]|nr:type I restriction enzyme HsdR N-terminal domain-containing protein [Desulfobulbaceae bacterium]MCK5403955.1 type I restriction enzyme HsdR N-terminal domain-containing protein [Desulfobulbaceae bacterium]